MTISLRLSEEDALLFKNYAALYNISVSELVRLSVMERIENEIDLAAIRAYEAIPNRDSISHEDLKHKLGL